MSEQCQRRAILIVTRNVRGTASNVAKQRLELSCTQPAGHPGPHADSEHGETWEEDGRELTTILRHETDE